MLEMDHIGYAVKRTDRAVKSMKCLGYVFEPTIRDKSRKLDITFGECDGYRIELVCPYEKGTAVDKILSAMGSMPYHFCYRSDDFEVDLGKLIQGGGYKQTLPPKEAVAFGGKRVCFLYSLGCGLIEIVESEK